MKAVFPLPVGPGDTIGVAAPAGPFDTGLFDKGLKVLEALGFRLRVPRAVFAKTGYLAGSDRQRAETLQRLFEDPEVRGIVCARGGYGSMRMLPYLDFERISSHPKALVGFSDVSALLSVIYTRCGLVCFHGPTVTTLGCADAATVHAFARAIGPGRITRIRPRAGCTLAPGCAAGPFAGGNLTILCHLMGTGFEPDLDGRILLLEDVNEAPYRIDRMLTQMRLCGYLDHVRGLVLGTFENCGRPGEVDRIVTEAFDDLDIPILAGFDLGHGKTNLTVPMGADALLDSHRQVLDFAGGRPPAQPGGVVKV